MGKNKDVSLFKDLMENVWNPHHFHKYNYKYFIICCFQYSYIVTVNIILE
jgi:hypothetical protein